MKIVFGASRDSIAGHAKLVVTEAQQKSREPIGIAVYSAKVPDVCEDCGVTYSHLNDPYQWHPHVGCKNGKALGFK